MATSYQPHGHVDSSCLPCVGNTSRSDRMNQPHRPLQTKTEHNEMKQTEDLLASELNKLSVQERAEAFDDVHCVGEELKETPEMIEKSLKEFEEAVQRERTQVYDMAWNQNRAYVEDPSFRLQFLRANMHDVDKSVRQMMRFLQQKAMYFGDDKVAREITLDDLNEEDKEVLLSGLWHVQEERDRTGRVIVHMMGNMFGKWKAENTIRAVYFIYINIVIRDPVAQIKGLVSVYHNISRNGEKSAMAGIGFITKVNDASMSFPIRYSANHFCLQTREDNLVLHNAFLKPLMNILPQYIRVRSRIHVGSSVELRYQLPSHGIPLDTFPIDDNGNVRENILNLWFFKYLQQMQFDLQGDDGNTSTLMVAANRNTNATFWGQQQVPMDVADSSNQALSVAQNNQSTPLVPYMPFAMAQSGVPTENDILLGRGRFAQSWDGNVMFREWAEKLSDDYDILPRAARQKRTVELTHELIAKGIRFFEQQESGEWVEADFSEARKKVSQMFRTIRKKK